jgi:hypothetical protein
MNEDSSWTNSNLILGSPSVLCYSINADFTILAYIDNNNEVYVSKYDAATDMYINPTKVTLNTDITNQFTIKLSPDGTILTLFKLYLYIYRYNKVSTVYEYVQALNYNYNGGIDFYDVSISTSNYRIVTNNKYWNGDY